MDSHNFDSLSLAINALTEHGYSEDFKAEDKFIRALYSKKEYSPENLTIVSSFRFEGITNPEDETELFAIEADDGTKGTLVMSYSAEHYQNVDLIRQIKETSSVN